MGPLAGLKIIEVVGLGAAPYCGMMLADMGAEVVRVDRYSAPSDAAKTKDPLARGRRSMALNLKSEAGVETLLQLLEKADGLFEGFRPGVAERLGFGPDICLQRNKKLVFGRLTGWGQEGPLAGAVGHDINYIALTGALHSIGTPGNKPVPPLNLAGDFGGGGLLLAFGMVCALFEAQQSGKGQVVDAAMIDGAASFMAMFFHFQAHGTFSDAPGTHMLGGAAPFYSTYETADGKYISIGSIEPQFYRKLFELTGIDPAPFTGAAYQGVEQVMDTTLWPELEKVLAAVFRKRTRDEWCEIMEGSDVCFAPVLGLSEVHLHPHHVARDTFIEINGQIQAGADTEAILTDWGFSEEQILILRNEGGLA